MSPLAVGQQYKITDFATTHIIYGTYVLNTGITEPIIVTAATDSTLVPIAYSTIYPQDILYYSVKNAINTYEQTLKWFIESRIDTNKDIDVPFDFRNVKQRRYKCYLTSMGLSNDYYLWFTSQAGMGYNSSTNTSYTLIGDSTDYKDYYVFNDSADPNAKDIKWIDSENPCNPAMWSTASYDVYIRGTYLFALTFGNEFNLNTIIATSSTIN
mgnify:CR=1 FL=1